MRKSITSLTGQTLLGCLLLFSAGCASVDKQAAGKLATQGALVANTVGGTYQSTDQDLDKYVEAEFLMSGITPGYSAPNDDLLKSIGIVQKELLLRQQLFQGLSDTYTSFGALCAYDAQGEVEKSLSNSITAGNNLSTALGGGSLSDSAGQLFAKAGGGIVGHAQSARIKDASAKIRALLQGMVLLLQKTNEQAAVVATREEISRGKLKIAKMFWTSNFASADAIFAEQIQSYGLTPNASELSHAAQNQGLQSGISAVLAWRQKQEAEAQDAAYAASVQSLRSLINEHVKIEAGQPVNLAAIQSYLSTIQAYVDLAAAAKKGK